jgi:ribonuclease R
LSKRSLPEQILDALAEARGGLDRRQLARVLKVRPAQKSEMKAALVELLHQGRIEKTARRRYQRVGTLPSVMVVRFTGTDEDGELLAVPKDAPENSQIIRLAPGEAAQGPNAVGVGDLALVRLAEDDTGYLARVIKKLDRQDHGPMLGLIAKARGRWRIEPVNRKSKTTHILRAEDQNSVSEGDLVRFTPLPGRRDGLRQAKLVERIGSVTAPKAASLLSLAEQGIEEGFTAEEEEQAANAREPKLGQRSDLRSLPLITIDPDDARDFDDALHAHLDDDPKNRGGWVVWVAIADVAAFVPTGSPLDKGARKRGNSIYLPDRVVPMLPERLSADLCSLRPDEDRACMAVRMVFDAEGNKRGHKFVRALMRSHARLTYEQAQTAMDGQCDETTAPIVASLLKPLWGAFHALQAARARREPLEIETNERKIRIGDLGQIVSITSKERLDAHRLVEEFMIQANVAAARQLEAKHQPLIYRVHDAPEQAKVFALSEFLNTVGMKWAKGQRATPGRFNQLLRKAAGTDLAQMINQVVLRSQMRAIYDTHNIGHFGLSLEHYCHFTSPIRRYADLTIHRALIRACKLGDDGASDGEQAQLKAIAEQISLTERTAMAAERDAASRYVAAHLSERIGAVFPAHVSGVTRFGLFLSLDESGADGLVPVRSLGDEYFHYEEHAHALIGRDTGGRYRLGMAVQVRLIEATPVTGGLLFEMLSQPQAGPKPKRSGRSHDRQTGDRKHRRRGNKKTFQRRKK